MVTISVVVPSWNDAKMLETCLRALAVQTRPADEVIVVDNASTDATAAVADRAGARVVSEPSRGIWPATSRGFDEAHGEVLARLDADSIPSPDWIERIAATFEQPDAPTAVTNDATFYGGNPFTRWVGRRLYLGAYFGVIGALLGHPPVFGSNFAMTRDAWLRVRSRVHRARGDMNDDFDLSWWLEPEMTVIRDRTLVVEVSARPFASFSALGHRLGMAFRTLGINLRAWPAHKRRAARRSAARRQQAAHRTKSSDGLRGQQAR